MERDVTGKLLGKQKEKKCFFVASGWQKNWPDKIINAVKLQDVCYISLLNVCVCVWWGYLSVTSPGGVCYSLRCVSVSR